MSSTKRVRAILASVMALLMAFSTVVLGGCAGATGSREIVLTPVVSNPVIGTDGVLKVGVDSTQVPYAGMFENKLVGIDVDVAAALAEKLGLKLELVDTRDASSLDTLLAEGTVDMVMHIEQTSGSVIRGTKVGPYLQSGPALFTVTQSDTVPTVDLQSLAGTKIAAQKDSLSAWSLEELIGKGTADPRESLADALAAVEKREVSYAAADAVVGSYLAIESEGLSCVKLLGTPIDVSVGVTEANTALAEALTTALRTIRDNGELKTILAKWLGPVSATVVMGSSAVVAQATGGSGGTAAVLPEGTVDTGDDLPDPSNAGGI